MATNPLPNIKVPIADKEGHPTLPWWRWFQQGIASATGAPGPPGPEGPGGPSGPPGPSGAADDTLGMIALGQINKGVQSVTSTTADLSVVQPYSNVRLTINSAPKWDTARTLSFTGDATGSNTVDGSASVATALTLATVNASPGTFGDATHVAQVTVNAKGLATTVASVAILPTLSHFTNSLSGNVALNNTGTVFDGPSVAQGTSGTWFASGTVTVNDTAGSAAIFALLWDGTTVIASSNITTSGVATPIALSGVLASPAGNLRISCQDVSSIHGNILATSSGNTASTITAIRIG